MPTRTLDLTHKGTIVGTLQYMAPEQLEGKEADARADIFALGELIYEMATGKPAFSGKSRASLIAAILTAEPQPIESLQPMTPVALGRIVKKCLAKDPDERWQSARDLAAELKWIAEGGSGGCGSGRWTAAACATVKANGWAYIAAAATLIAVAALTTRFFTPSQPPLPTVRFSMLPPEGVIFRNCGPSRYFAGWDAGRFQRIEGLRRDVGAPSGLDRSAGTLVPRVRRLRHSGHPTTSRSAFSRPAN